MFNFYVLLNALSWILPRVPVPCVLTLQKASSDLVYTFGCMGGDFLLLSCPRSMALLESGPCTQWVHGRVSSGPLTRSGPDFREFQGGICLWSHSDRFGSHETTVQWTSETFSPSLAWPGTSRTQVGIPSQLLLYISLLLSTIDTRISYKSLPSPVFMYLF